MYPCLIGYEIEPAKWLEAGWFVTPRGMVLFPAKNYRRTIFVNARDPQRIKCFRLFLISFFPFYFSFFFFLPQPAECGAEETYSKRCPDAGVGRDCLGRI